VKSWREDEDVPTKKRLIAIKMSEKTLCKPQNTYGSFAEYTWLFGGMTQKSHMQQPLEAKCWWWHMIKTSEKTHCRLWGEKQALQETYTQRKTDVHSAKEPYAFH